MTQDPQNEQQKDPELLKQARKRVGFQQDISYYVIICLFLWVLWLLGGGFRDKRIPWPVWPTAGWGLALLLGYINVYKWPRAEREEREYQKLKERQKK